MRVIYGASVDRISLLGRDWRLSYLQSFTLHRDCTVNIMEPPFTVDSPHFGRIVALGYSV